MNDLFEKLARCCDPESALVIYLEVDATEKQLAEVKEIARCRIEVYMRDTDKTEFVCLLIAIDFQNGTYPFVTVVDVSAAAAALEELSMGREQVIERRFICSHCGRIAFDTTTTEVLDDGATLRCADCGKLTKVSLIAVAGDVADNKQSEGLVGCAHELVPSEPHGNLYCSKCGVCPTLVVGDATISAPQDNHSCQCGLCAGTNGTLRPPCA